MRTAEPERGSRHAVLHRDLRAAALAMTGWLLIALTLALSLAWQWQGRAHQRVDVGSLLDNGYLLNFNERERSAANAELTYRWSRLSSGLLLWAPPPGTPVVVALRMLASPQPNGPQQVAISVAERPLARIGVTPDMRTYRFLVMAPRRDHLAIGLESRPLLTRDARQLGVALDSVTLDALGGPIMDDILSELWSAPFLPLGLLLLAICGRLLRLPRPLTSGLPALALAGVALLARFLLDTGLVLASSLVAFAACTAAALVLAALLRRVPRLWPATDRRAQRWLLLVFIITLATTFSPTIRSDGIRYYAYLHSLTMDGDLQLGNDFRDWPFQPGPNPDELQVTSTGYYVNPFSIGPALVWSPLYGVAHLIVVGGRALGIPWHADGYDAPYIVLSTFTSALAGLVIMLTGYRVCRRWVGPPVAALAAVSAFLGSNLLFYTMREGSFAHALSSAAASLYVLAWLRLEERPTLERWAALGATGGAMVLMYWISALVLLLAVLTFVRLLVMALRGPAGQRRQRLAHLLFGGVVATILLLLIFSPQLIAWKIIYGSFVTVPQGLAFISPHSFQGLALVFSPLHGLLPWTPAFFAGMVGLPLLWRRGRWQATCLGPAFLIYFGYNAWLLNWYGDGAFGLRRITVLTPWFIIGLALVFDALRRWRPALPFALAALMSSWTTLLLVRYDLHLIPHEPTQLRRMSVVSFYLSRDTLPLWGVLGWLRNSFFFYQLRTLSSPATASEFLTIVVVMALATWAVATYFDRIEARRSQTALPARRAPLQT